MFEFFSSEGLPDKERSMINHAIKQFYIAKSVDDAGTGILNSIRGDDGKARLTKQDLLMSVALKRRALGLPLDDDDYEEMINSGNGPDEHRKTKVILKRLIERVEPHPSSTLSGRNFDVNFLKDLLEKAKPAQKTVGAIEYVFKSLPRRAI